MLGADESSLYSTLDILASPGADMDIPAYLSPSLYGDGSTARPKRYRESYTLEMKRNTVERWEKSGLTRQEFCQQNELKYHTFKKWVHKWGHQRNSNPSSLPGTSHIMVERPESKKQRTGKYPLLEMALYK